MKTLKTLLAAALLVALAAAPAAAGHIIGDPPTDGKTTGYTVALDGGQADYYELAVLPPYAGPCLVYAVPGGLPIGKHTATITAVNLWGVAGTEYGTPVPFDFDVGPPGVPDAVSGARMVP